MFDQAALFATSAYDTQFGFWMGFLDDLHHIWEPVFGPQRQ
jgi:hypothetical protein